jgi:replication factor C subunit 2/4
VIPPSRIADLLVATKSNAFRHIQSAAQEMVYAGYPVDAILQQFLMVVMADETIGDVAKAKISVRLAENEHKLIEGADEYLQLLDVLSFTSQTITTL